MNDLVYDIIIIGGGPAGLTAGLYAVRSKLKTLLLEKISPGGQAILTDIIENYPGFIDGISGYELTKNIHQQTKKFGLEILTEEVIKIEKITSGFKIFTQDNQYQTLSIIIATGSFPKKLNISGEEKLTGRGVSFCAVCDGPFFKEKEIFVIGGGNTAVGEAIYLTKFAKKVNIVHRRDRLRATKIIQEKAYSNPKCNFIFNSIPLEIIGDKKVEGIKIKNLQTEEIAVYPADGVFIFVGFEPQTKFLDDLVKLDEQNYIITDEEMKTSTSGVFAAGDVRKKTLRQIVTACSDGAIAAFSAQNYIDNIKYNLS